MEKEIINHGPLDITFLYHRISKMQGQRDNLLAACEAAYELLYNQMDDAEQLDHMANGDDGETCVLCQLREAIARSRGE